MLSKDIYEDFTEQEDIGGIEEGRFIVEDRWEDKERLCGWYLLILFITYLEKMCKIV
jgi:hypothetical protein